MAYIEGLLEQAPRGGQGKLPTLRRLAAAAGVSYVTASRALSRLVRGGRLEARPGRGTVVAGAPQLGASRMVPATRAAPRPRRRPERWLQLAGEMERETVEGRYRDGLVLPSLKELAVGHGVNYRTLRKALDHLAERRVVVPFRRTYRVLPRSSGRGRGTVVLVARANMGGRQQMFDARTAEKLRMLESQCAQSRVDLEMVPVQYRGEQIVPADGAPGFGDVVREQAVLGFVVWTMGLSLPAALELEQRLSEYGKPVAVLDEDDTLHDARPAGARTRLFVSAGTSQCGMDVGRYLRRLGHQRVAYFTVFAGDPWSGNRLSGLRNAYGGDSTVVREWQAASVDADLSDSEKVAQIAATLGQLGVAHSTRSMSTAAAEEQARTMVRRQLLHERLWPVFEGALGDSTVTAWAGANDDVALQCLEFLRGRSIDVPGRMSVMGFDDTFDATYWQMTSYSFRTSAVVSSMLSYVLRPGVPRRQLQPAAVEIQGMVVERATTGPVAGVRASRASQ